MPRLIATDLDGTLLNDDTALSPRTVAALAAAERAGIDILFVTSRPACWMHVVGAYVPGHGLAVCGNGAAVVDLRAAPGPGCFAAVRPLPTPEALAVVRILRAAAPGTTFAVERTDGLHVEPAYPPLFTDPVQRTAPAERLLAHAAGQPVRPVLKLLAHHPRLGPEAFQRLARDAVGERATLTRSAPFALLEISGRGVSKASTLALCCARRGISPAAVLAFGDIPNDLEMLAWAGTSYAMANAHPEVHAAATHATASNNEDGVARVIESLLAGHPAPHRCERNDT